jgi:hypothetical protein
MCKITSVGSAGKNTVQTRAEAAMASTNAAPKAKEEPRKVCTEEKHGSENGFNVHSCLAEALQACWRVFSEDHRL